jgi:hypothetical protein
MMYLHAAYNLLNKSVRYRKYIAYRLMEVGRHPENPWAYAHRWEEHEEASSNQSTYYRDKWGNLHRMHWSDE